MERVLRFGRGLTDDQPGPVPKRPTDWTTGKSRRPAGRAVVRPMRAPRADTSLSCVADPSRWARQHPRQLGFQRDEPHHALQ